MPLETNLSQNLEVFSYLKELELGEEITISVYGTPEKVLLIRRGRQNVRIERENGDRDMIPLGDVVLPD